MKADKSELLREYFLTACLLAMVLQLEEELARLDEVESAESDLLALAAAS